MRAAARWVFEIAIGAVLFFGGSLIGQPARVAPGEPFHPTRIVAKFAPVRSADLQAAVVKQQRLTVVHQYAVLPKVVVLDLSDANEAKAAMALAPQVRSKRLWEQIAALRATGLFEHVEPDYVRSINLEQTDSAYTDGTLWALHNSGRDGGTPGADIGAVPAWDITTGSTNVIVAIVDTGIRYTHQDLAG